MFFPQQGRIICTALKKTNKFHNMFSVLKDVAKKSEQVHAAIQTSRKDSKFVPN